MGNLYQVLMVNLYVVLMGNVYLVLIGNLYVVLMGNLFFNSPVGYLPSISILVFNPNRNNSIKLKILFCLNFQFDVPIFRKSEFTVF